MNQAVRRNFEEKASYFARSLPNMVVVDHGSFLAVDCGLPSDTYNVIVARDVTDPIQLLYEGVGHFVAKSFPVAIWYWEQADDQAGVTALAAYGLAHSETNVAMVAELAVANFHASQPEGLVITHAKSPHAIQQYGNFIARQFSHSEERNSIEAYFQLLSQQPLDKFPAMRHYLGKYHNRVVASGVLFVGSETVGIYDIVTAVDFRRRGIGSAMFARLLNEAKSYGRRYAALQASPAGMGIYLRAGFAPVGNVHVFENRAML